jgi:hypothetical protein
VLAEAEPVARVVPEDRLDAVRPLGRLLEERDAARLEFLVGPFAVVRLDAPPAIAPFAIRLDKTAASSSLNIGGAGLARRMLRSG